MKPIEAIVQFNAQMDMYCPHLRRAQTGWKCGPVERATGAEPCMPEDWAGCKLNSGGKLARDRVEILL